MHEGVAKVSLTSIKAGRGAQPCAQKLLFVNWLLGRTAVRPYTRFLGQPTSTTPSCIIPASWLPVKKSPFVWEVHLRKIGSDGHPMLIQLPILAGFSAASRQGSSTAYLRTFDPQAVVLTPPTPTVLFLNSRVFHVKSSIIGAHIVSDFKCICKKCRTLI